MKQTLLTLILCSVFGYANAQDAEKLIKTYLTGFEKKDWNMTSSAFAPNFTFTSPAGDNHISLTQYKEKCWGTSKYFKEVEFPKIMVDGNTAFAIYDITTTDNKIVHNVEYYIFKNGKIESIECFFGAGTGYPGNPGVK